MQHLYSDLEKAEEIGGSGAPVNIYRVKCSCGWKGLWTRYTSQADEYHNKHIRDSKKGL